MTERWVWEGHSLMGAPDWVLSYWKDTPPGWRNRINVEPDFRDPRVLYLVVPTQEGDRILDPGDTLVWDGTGTLRIELTSERPQSPQ